MSPPPGAAIVPGDPNMSTTPQPAANAAPPATIRVGLGPAAREPDRHWLLLIVAGALLLRLAMAVLMPTLSRDGVTFCWYARDLGQAGLAHLQAETTHQHPLFPAAVLAVQIMAVADAELREKLRQFKKKQEKAVRDKDAALSAQGK